MNFKDWQEACDLGIAPRRYDNASREIQKSLKYNPDPNAIIRHHLRDTEEQRKYNDEHYELWGFEIDENGNEHFKYGKYLVFCTKYEHHNVYHNIEGDNNPSRKREWTDEYRDELSKRLSGSGNPFYGKHHTQESKQKMSESSHHLSGEDHPMHGKHHTQESIEKISNNRKGKCTGENNPMYGKTGEQHPFYGHHITESHKNSISNSQRGRFRSDEEKEKNRLAHLGKHHSDSSKEKISTTLNIKSRAYKLYKENGGQLSWNDFQKIPINEYYSYNITL